MRDLSTRLLHRFGNIAYPENSRRVTGRLAAGGERGVERLWLFAAILFAQLGHLIEHIAKQLTGSAFLGPVADNELSHLLFNLFIAVAAVALVRVYPLNPWAYPLVLLSVLHGIEHIYIYREFLVTGVSNGPGLFGVGGAIGLIPLDRLDLHNVYNGFEMILMVLGVSHETEVRLARGE